ncbi:MAG: sensor histidine kinase [Acidobacteriota bacterium]
MIFLVIVALGVSWLEAGPPMAFVVESLLTVGAALAWMVWVGERLERTSPLARRSLYFVVQLALLGLVAVVFVRYRTFSVAWLFYMPVITLARLKLPLAGTVTVCLASLGVIALHIEALGGWRHVPGSLLAISTAVVFVVLITDIAQRERIARTDAQRLGDELEDANRRLGRYAVQAEELAMARERTRMAREIHDSVGHSLTAVHMQIEAARTMLERDPATACDALTKAQRCVKDGLNEIRRSVSSLRAEALEGRDLPAALEALTRRAATDDLSIDLRVDGAPRPLPPAVALTLYRCAQEALTNARKHARAARVEVTLRYPSADDAAVEAAVDLADDPTIALTVRDDGAGVDPATLEEHGGFGLLGLRERARQLDGAIEITSRPGDGFALAVHLPLPVPAEPALALATDRR